MNQNKLENYLGDFSLNQKDSGLSKILQRLEALLSLIKDITKVGENGVMFPDKNELNITHLYWVNPSKGDSMLGVKLGPQNNWTQVKFYQGTGKRYCEICAPSIEEVKHNLLSKIGVNVTEYGAPRGIKKQATEGGIMYKDTVTCNYQIL